MVRAKKHLGQHFLKDENIALKIVSSLTKDSYSTVLEIGAGTGALTKHLLRDKTIDLYIVELDTESVNFLKKNYPAIKEKIFELDFLGFDFETSRFKNLPIGIIGNFPYNISSQILFKVYEQRTQVREVVGMFQKEVADRIVSGPGTKQYGILSVLIQAFFDAEYLFTVNENVFIPPPRVKSAVIRLKRNTLKKLDCDETFFKTVVKTAFNYRRKTLKNALKSLKGNAPFPSEKWEKLRAEQLTVNDFVFLTNWFVNMRQVN